MIGNMESDAGKVLSYPETGAAHSHAAISDGSFTYGSQTKYVSDLYECTASGCSKFVFSGLERITQIVSGTTESLHGDHLGSASLMTAANGAVMQKISYYPFGKMGNDSSPLMGVSHRFTDQEWDFDLGLYDSEARYYDPDLMRFISADPIGVDLNNPQTLNRYSYVLNNPLKYIDPTGNEFDDCYFCWEWTNDLDVWWDDFSLNTIFDYSPSTSVGQPIFDQKRFPNESSLFTIDQLAVNSSFFSASSDPQYDAFFEKNPFLKSDILGALREAKLALLTYQPLGDSPTGGDVEGRYIWNRGKDTIILDPTALSGKDTIYRAGVYGHELGHLAGYKNERTNFIIMEGIIRSYGGTYTAPMATQLHRSLKGVRTWIRGNRRFQYGETLHFYWSQPASKNYAL